MNKQLLLHIESTPPGEAPMWVREKWIGLRLPLLQSAPEPMRLNTGGVISGPRTRFQLWMARFFRRLEPASGYLVGVLPAIEVLERTSPEAAAWWRENASHILQPEKVFLFHAEACRVVEEPNNSLEPTR